MLKSFRFSIAGLMGAVLVAAVGLAALHDGSPIWAGIIFLLTCAILSLGIVGLAFRRPKRVWWFGFCLFGWSYLAIALWSLFYAQPTLPTESVLQWLYPILGRQDDAFTNVNAGVGLAAVRPTYFQIGHCLWALLVAVAGGLLSSGFFASRGARCRRPAPRRPYRGRRQRRGAGG